MCGSVEDKKSFSTYASELKRLMKYTDRDDVTGHMRRQCEAIAAIYGMLQKKRKHTDTTDLMVEINAIINDYVEIEPQQPSTLICSAASLPKPGGRTCSCAIWMRRSGGN